MTHKRNNINGLSTQTTEHQLPTAVLRNGGFSGKLKCSFSINLLCRLTVYRSEIPHFLKPQTVVPHCKNIRQSTNWHPTIKSNNILNIYNLNEK
jgi:hypothetical protein